jgi:hypothetical protein
VRMVQVLSVLSTPRPVVRASCTCEADPGYASDAGAAFSTSFSCAMRSDAPLCSMTAADAQRNDGGRVRGAKCSSSRRFASNPTRKAILSLEEDQSGRGTRIRVILHRTADGVLGMGRPAASAIGDPTRSRATAPVSSSSTATVLASVPAIFGSSPWCFDPPGSKATSCRSPSATT